ncbi:nuclear pore complex protein NUP107 [Morus notabilis]|uniref:nuclear pore complex protein NUP107 n=1 Tax=Morus notabilis TaxID=981085 RepID=UPI000CED3A02|nr:nuclear pore complex protein NUP107 [Morus notabilis]
MDVEMDASPSYFDPEDLTIREQYRRYGKRPSGSSISPHRENSPSKFSESRLLYDGHDIHSPTNAALILENIKNEADSIDASYSEGTPLKTHLALKRSLSYEGHGIPEVDFGFDSVRSSLKACKREDETLTDGGDTTFTFFASLLDSALQGLMPIPDLILRFEKSCRNVSESIRYGSNVRHRVVEDKLMRQKAQLLLDEAASWSLLWYLYGKGTEDIPKELILLPPTSHLEACQFVAEDHTAQLCLRIVQWLEDLASKALDLERKVRGSHIGTYLPTSGIWHHTQRYLKKGASNTSTIHHLDFDAPTREHAYPLPDDKKQDESLLEDLWALLRAGRLEEACNLCRSAGQPWRAATLCPFGGLDQFPSVEALLKNGKGRTLQAIELESGIGHQWRLWRWASYCASEKIAHQDGGKFEAAVYAAQCSNLQRMLSICTDWESACWAMAKSWLEVQVDLELANLQPGSLDQFRNSGDVIDGSSDHASQRSNRPENWPLQVLNLQPRQLSDLLRKLHSGEMVHESVTRACKDQQRQIEMVLMSGDIPRLLDLIWSWIAPSDDDQSVFSVHVKHKIFLSAVEYLPFSAGDDSKGSFEEIIERVLSRSRETKFGKDNELSDVAEQHRLQSLQKAMVTQWLCFTTPSTINNVKEVSLKLLLRALIHSNILFREFALISMWRVPAMPIGAHRLLSFLAEPLKQLQELSDTLENYNVSENLREFQDWSEYYSCDATYRNWLKIELENSDVSPLELSLEEKQRVTSAAKEALNSSLLLLMRKENPWLEFAEDRNNEMVEPVFLELHATAALCLPSGECMCPDATICTTLMSALYSSVSEEIVTERQLTVNVSISSADNYCIEVVLRCLAVAGDGLGPRELNDGGILGTITAAGFKGELPRFQAGVTMEISRLDAWFSSKDGSLEVPAMYIVRGLCRRCCLPELILRSMQVSVSLMESGVTPEIHDDLIELVGSPETGYFHLFSQQQLQEFLLFEREYSIFQMEHQEEELS